MLGQFSGSQFEGLARTPKRRKHVELSLTESMLSVHHHQFIGQMGRKSMKPAEHTLRRDVEVWSFTLPLRLNARYSVR